MPSMLLLLAALVTNYVRHRQNKSTICSTTRSTIPRPYAAAGLLAVFGWLFPHVIRGYVEDVTRAC